MTKIKIKNNDAITKEILITCTEDSVQNIVEWYMAYASGDDINIEINNKDNIRELDTKDDRELTEMVKDIEGIVEATSFEKMCIWERETARGTTWVDKNSGFLITIGHYYKMPTCISITTAIVDGVKLLFIDPTSLVVHHDMIREWCKKYINCNNRTDAINFYNVVRSAKDKQET